MKSTTLPNPPRVAYHDTQRLAARDLQDDMAHEAQLRRLHVIGLHNTWGVALGLEVGIVDDGAAILVGPGMAYDYKGREIVLSQSEKLNPPPIPTGEPGKAWWYDLVIRYDPQTSLPRPADIGAACPTSDLNPRQEHPIFRWAYAGRVQQDVHPPLPDSIRQGEEVPLARVRLGDTGRVTGLDFSQRRTAQGLVRPHIAGDQVVGTATASTTQDLSWSIRVNTFDYGFSSATPSYFVQLTDHPLRALQASASLTYPAFLDRILGPFLSVEFPSRYEFTLRVRFGVNGSVGTGHDPNAALLAALRETQELSLAFNWYGIEPVTGCQPAFTGYTVMYLYDLILPGLFFPIFG